MSALTQLGTTEVQVFSATPLFPTKIESCNFVTLPHFELSSQNPTLSDLVSVSLVETQCHHSVAKSTAEQTGLCLYKLLFLGTPIKGSHSDAKFNVSGVYILK
jgi:hypothetical protein